MKLVIVESPAKCSKIASFLGQEYCVKASFGHIRDLDKGLQAIDVTNGFKPSYIITPSKKKVVSELKKFAKKADEVIIASDLDREGEAIGYHVAKVLRLSTKTTKRIVFNKITKKAVQEAICSSRTLDMNLVYAQQARRILDRLIGFTLSPVLWKYVRHSLSAGRCQSPAIKLIQEKEDDISKCTDSSSFVFTADFYVEKGTRIMLPAQFTHTVQTPEESHRFLELCSESVFTITSIKITKHKNNPPPPFVTSTLQQSASSTLNISPKETMQIAQKLYEAGLITYMRTDSTELSSECIGRCKEYILEHFSEEYHKVRQYKSKSKNSQEAHEAIRPVHVEQKSIEGQWTSRYKSLYSLIWKRTMASQMASKCSEKKTFTIGVVDTEYEAESTCIRTTFPGYSILYESSKTETEGKRWSDISPIQVNDCVQYQKIVGTQSFKSPPSRYTEASLIKALEKKGIGRPSTYSSILSTIMDRSYVQKRSSAGVKKEQYILSLKPDKGIESSVKKIIVHREKNKLFLTDMGRDVSTFLNTHFRKIMDFKYTSEVEEELDKIAKGEIKWDIVVSELYKNMMSKVQNISAEPKKKTGSSYERQLKGLGMYNNKNVYIFQGKNGIAVQWGEDKQKDTVYYRLTFPENEEKLLEDVELKDTLYLFEYPKSVGEYQKYPIHIHKGPYGIYLKYRSNNYGIPKDKPVVTHDEAVKIIEESIKKKRHLGNDIYIINGPYGFYINHGKSNRSLPKEYDPENISLEEATHILSQPKKKWKRNKK